VNQKTILIADDDKDVVQSLAMRCRAIGLKVLTAHSGMDAAIVAGDHTPDLLCLDVNMPCGNGLSVCEMLTSHHQFTSSQIIIMTGNADQETVRRCHKLCAYYVEKSQELWQRLEPLIKNALQLPADSQEIDNATPVSRATPSPDDTKLRESHRKLVDVVFTMLGADADYLLGDAADAELGEATTESGDGRPWLLCIDDDAEYSLALKLRFEQHGIGVQRAFAGMDGFRQAFMRPAEAILLDYEMPNGQGDYILGRLKDNPVTKDIPVIVVTGRKERSLERKMLNLGAARFLTKPIDFSTLLAEVQQHTRRENTAL